MRYETIEAIQHRAWHPAGSNGGHTRFCWHCDREVSAERAGPGWRLGVPALVIAVFASVTVAVLAGPFMVLALVPLLLFSAALGPYVAKMRSAASCPRCGREVPYTTREAAYSAHGGSRLHDGAHVPERPMH
ncbi:hypothetical protein [Sandaracinus amylolyticus]|uniref:hypothetical protein n=1 Tax=Sandaracinus amylolyticus TaxID=927083 RepID=UPI001F31762C|nr:hypothetical protein [Sandaracinus amylolyticus]UJR85834.1 Hypothetical protein I5071_79140 [Sandaracinus amylolyticus]